MSASSINLKVGDVITRSALALEYGGATQGGIIASIPSRKVFIFADRSEGGRLGYVYDGFSPDGAVLYYTGAGQKGDQVETGSNSPITTHAEKERSLHAFIADGFVDGTQTKLHRYIGEFYLDPDQRFDRMPAPDRDGSSRTVIVFRLLPAGGDVPREIVNRVGVARIHDQPVAMEVPSEINSNYFFETSPREAGVASRKESQLVDEFITSQHGHEFSRWAIPLPGENSPLLTDVYDRTEGVLYEAKASAGRADIRMAVGQLLDYRRYVQVQVAELRCSLLLPSRPKEDLRDFVRSVGVEIVYKDSRGHFSVEERLGSLDRSDEVTSFIAGRSAGAQSS